MHRVVFFAWVTAAAASFELGCGSDASDTAPSGSGTSSTESGTPGANSSASGTGGAAGSGAGGAGGAGGAIPTIVLSGTAIGGQGPIAGVKVCVLDHADLPCATTDSTGGFTVHAPASAETGVTLIGTGYGGVLLPIATSSQDQQGWVIGLSTAAATAGFYASAGAKYPDAGKGFLAVTATGANPQQGVAGVAVAISPASGMGPIYAGPTNDPDPSLQATSTPGLARFASVAPAIVEVILTPTTGSCALFFGGWPSTKPNAVRVPIADGLETHVGLKCM